MESKEKEFRQYRSNQGRNPERMVGSYRAVGLSFVVIIILTICSAIGLL